jgi:cytochrome P450
MFEFLLDSPLGDRMSQNPVVSLLICAAAICALRLTAIIVYNLYLHPLAKYPGPWHLAISDVFYARMIVGGNVHNQLLQMHEKYGEVVRIAPNDLSFTGAGAWKDIYGHRPAGSTLLKDPRFYFTDEETRATNIFTTKDPVEHARQRKMLSHAFSAKALNEQEGTIRKYIDELMIAIRGESAKGNPLDMVEYFNWATFDIIGDMGFGEPFGCLERRQTDPWVSKILSTASFIGYDIALNRLPWPFNVLGQYAVPKKIRDDRITHIDDSKKKILKRLDSKSDRKDFVSYFTKGEGHGMTEWQLATNSHTLIFAGSETTASMLASWMYCLLANPRTYEILRDEIRGAFKSTDEITLQKLVALPYLNATLNEALRMYPPVPLAMPRVSPKGGVTIDGHLVPEGVSYYFQADVACRHELIRCRSRWAFLNISASATKTTFRMRIITYLKDGQIQRTQTRKEL